MKNLTIISLEDQLLQTIERAGLHDLQRTLADEVQAPLMKEVACKIQKAWCSTQSIRLIPEPINVPFILKHILPLIEKNHAWDTLSPKEKQERYAAAMKTLLETNPQVIKDALMHNADLPTKAFLSSLHSYTDQSYLSTLMTSHPAQMQLFFTRTEKGITLRKESMDGLTRANLTLAPLALLKEIAQNYHSVQLHLLNHNDRTLHWWFPHDMPSSVIQQAAWRMSTLYPLRSWFKSPGLETQRFVSWYFLPITSNKYFPKQGDTFTIEHLNSAEVLNEGTVYFRDEELLKNTVHEFFHGIRFEDGIDLATSSSLLKKRYAIEKPDALILAEAYVEAITTIVHTIFVAAESSEDFLKEYGELWALEKSFAFYQSAKMLAVGEFDSFNEFLAPDKTKKRIRETTVAAEYFILKTALLFTPEAVLTVVHTNPPDKQQMILALLDTNLHNPLFAHWIDALLLQIPKEPRTTELFKTGRVTLNEPCTGPATAQ